MDSHCRDIRQTRAMKPSTFAHVDHITQRRNAVAMTGGSHDQVYAACGVGMVVAVCAPKRTTGRSGAAATVAKKRRDDVH